MIAEPLLRERTPDAILSAANTKAKLIRSKVTVHLFNDSNFSIILVYLF